MELEDTSVSASAHDIAADGTLGPEEDLDELTSEACEEWFEGKKYLSEAHDDLLGLCLDLAADFPREGTDLLFTRARSARVSALLAAIAGGARWEKTSVGGRAAVRVVERDGSRISVLTDEEMKVFDGGVSEIAEGG